MCFHPRLTRFSQAFCFVLLLTYCTSDAPLIVAPLAPSCAEATYPDPPTSPYALPYPVGTAYRVTLANCAKSSHGRDSPDRFAYDFDLPIGAIITATRGGRVVFVEDRYEDGDVGLEKTNYIAIHHGDSTFARYAHLTHKGSFVNVGDKVKRGQPIGRSGNTGLSGFPHLHFDVTTGCYAFLCETIPVTFRNTTSSPNGLLQGETYRATRF